MSTLIDGLLDEARVLSKTGEVHGDIRITPYGTSVIVRDDGPREVDTAGGELTVYDGEIIAAGMGPTLTEAVSRANVSMKSRAQVIAE